MYYKSIDGKEGYRLIKLVKKKDAHFANPTDDFNLIKIYAENDKKAKYAVRMDKLKN